MNKMKKKVFVLILFLIFVGSLQSADVKIGDNNELIVNGKPFFLIGGWGPMRYYAYLKKLGINTIGIGPSEFFAQKFTTAMCLEEAKRLGLYTTCAIEEYDKVDRKHPTIIGWDQVDEPDYLERDQPGYIKNLIKTYNDLHAVDTRPVFVCFGSLFARGVPPIKNNLYVEYSEKTADVIMTDIYPVGNLNKPDELWVMAKAMKNLDKVTKGKKPIMIAVEVTKIAADAERAPTAAEVRSEVWMVIVHGAKGISYFSSSFNKIRYSPTAIPEDVEAELIKTNKEITDLTDVILSKDSTEKLEVIEPEGSTVATMLKSKGNKLYLFTVNMKKTPAKFKFIFNSNIKGEAEVYGENRKVKIMNNAIEDDYKSFEPHIYVVEK